MVELPLHLQSGENLSRFCHQIHNYEPGAYFWKNNPRSPILQGFGEDMYALLSFTGQQ